MKKSCLQSVSPSFEKVKSRVSITESDCFFIWLEKMLFLKNYLLETYCLESSDSIAILYLNLLVSKINHTMKNNKKWGNMKNLQDGTVTSILFSKLLAKNSKEKFIISLRGTMKNYQWQLVLIIRKFWLNKSSDQ